MRRKILAWLRCLICDHDWEFTHWSDGFIRQVKCSRCGSIPFDEGNRL